MDMIEACAEQAGERAAAEARVKAREQLARGIYRKALRDAAARRAT